jgi:hypothetical protein
MLLSTLSHKFIKKGKMPIVDKKEYARNGKVVLYAKYSSVSGTK